MVWKHSALEKKKEFEPKPGSLKMFKWLQTSGLKRFSSSIFCGSQDWKVKQAEIETTVHYNHVTAINSNVFLSLFHFNIMDCCRLSCDTQPCDLKNDNTGSISSYSYSCVIIPKTQNSQLWLYLFFNTVFIFSVPVFPDNKLASMCLPCSPDIHKQIAHAYAKPWERANRTKQPIHCHLGESYFCTPAFIFFHHVPITCSALQFKMHFTQHILSAYCLYGLY